MNSGEYYNPAVVDWARQTLKGRVEIKPLFSSTAGRIFVYALLFCVPGAFVALGILTFMLGAKDRGTLFGPFVFAVLTAIPCSLIALLGAYTRRGFASSLDAEGVKATGGQRFTWAKLYYVDHVTKHFRAGSVSRQVKDNQLELVFENGKVIIPPMIHDRAGLWSLINSIPVEIRDDGVPRPGHPSMTGSRQRTPQEELMAFLNALDKPPGPDAPE